MCKIERSNMKVSLTAEHLKCMVEVENNYYAGLINLILNKYNK